MQLGMIGLGRMGGNMVRRLMRAGHQCFVHDLDPKNIEALAKEGAVAVNKLEDFKKMSGPRAVWVMVPAGDPTEKTVQSLASVLEKGDIIIDGGNSNYKDDIRRGREMKERGIHYVDVGTSGGVWGLDRGYCMMIGGSDAALAQIDPILKSLAPGIGNIERTPGRESYKGKSTAEQGYLHSGPCGAGHFVKMIHNGIEYGMMQAFAEGFDIFKNANKLDNGSDNQFNFNLGEIAEVWRRGSVVSSWLLDLTAIALLQDPQLTEYTGFVQDSGEGRWTVQAAIDEAVPADVLTAALFVRFRSRQDHTFAEKVLSAMRHQFGGHTEKPHK